jgi:hypothetical protein
MWLPRKPQPPTTSTFPRDGVLAYASDMFERAIQGDVVPEIVVAEKFDQGRRAVGNGRKAWTPANAGISSAGTFTGSTRKQKSY